MRLIKWLFWLFLMLCVAGTAFAISEPENVMAAPFRGIAVKTLETSSGVMGLFRSARTVAATQEYSTILNALQTMMLNKNIRRLPPVETPVSDMSVFPSGESPLYPDYLSSQKSQFSYTISNRGDLLLSQSEASVDPALEQIYVIINRLQNAGR